MQNCIRRIQWNPCQKTSRKRASALDVFDKKDSWFNDVSRFVAASNIFQEGAFEKRDEFLEKFLKGAQNAKAKLESDQTITAGRGFYDTDIVLTEAKDDNNSAITGSGVLLQDPSTWGEVNESAYRFVVTAGHCVCIVQYNEVEKYNPIRLRIPIKPWKDFPQDVEKYRHGANEMKFFYSNIMCGPSQVFVHPDYKGHWDFQDIALIAIPSVTPSPTVRSFRLFNAHAGLTASSIVGFPLSTKACILPPPMDI